MHSPFAHEEAEPIFEAVREALRPWENEAQFFHIDDEPMPVTGDRSITVVLAAIPDGPNERVQIIVRPGSD